MEDMKLRIKGSEERTFTIHYSCSGFYNGGALAPSICCITMTNLQTEEIHTFALHNYVLQGKNFVEAERELLLDFVKFYNTLENPIVVHWLMDGSGYGFKAITARCENFGIYDLSFIKMQAFDLSIYSNSSLRPTLERNHCTSVNILGGKEEALWFSQRNYNAVKLSTEAKSFGLTQLLKLYLKNDMETGAFIFD